MPGVSVSLVTLTLSALRASFPLPKGEGGRERRSRGRVRVKTYDHQPSGTIDRARELRRASTDAEKKLWCGLREALAGHKFRRQMPIGPFFADFACFASRLVIELDGGQHAHVSEADAARTRFIEREGYRVIRFWNNDVMENLEGVLETVASALTSPTEASPSPFRAAPSLPLPAGEGQ